MNIPACVATHDDITRDRGSRSWLMSERPDWQPTCPLTYEQVGDLLKWMAVDSSKRWRPNGATYCNVYAADLLNILGLYLPRQWWKHPEQIQRSGSVPDIIWGETTVELSANRLYKWVCEYHEAFGIRRYHSRDAVYSALNTTGGIAIGIFHRNGVHGHIAVCFPDALADEFDDIPEHRGKLLNSQAGSTNYVLRRGGLPTIGGRTDRVFWGIYDGSELVSGESNVNQ